MALFVSQLTTLAVPRQFFPLMEVSPPVLRDVTSELVRDRDAALRRPVSGRKRDPERFVCKAAHAARVLRPTMRPLALIALHLLSWRGGGASPN
jgi:hypothetical protein